MSSKDTLTVIHNDFIDLEAPILPGKSAGGIAIGIPLKKLYPKLKYQAYSNAGKTLIDDPFYVTYKMGNAFSITIHILNSKVIKLACLPDYQGQMPNGIKVGMTIGEAQAIEPRIYFDDNEEQFYIHGIPGITLECLSSLKTFNKIEAITIFLPDLKESWNRDKELGEW